MGQLEQQMRHRDKEMVPRFLVQGMFGLMIGTLGIVAYAQWGNVPDVGVLVEAPIIKSRDIVFVGNQVGVYEVQNPDGSLIAISSENKAGFLGVIGRVVDRERMLHNVADDVPLQVVLRDNGNVAVVDAHTDMVVELIGYGKDNVAAFARLLD